MTAARRHCPVPRAPTVASLGATLALVGGLVPGGLTAQHVVGGRVVRAEDGAPVGGERVRVVGEDLSVRTDAAGRFRFELPADRPGVALRLEVFGFAPFDRSWILPLDRPIVIALEREAVPLEGIEVEVERPTGWAARPLEDKLEWRVRSMGGIERTAGGADLRAFPHQEAEVWDFLRTMNAAIGAGCPTCIMASGRIPNPRFIVDDRPVDHEEFRSYQVGEVCRVDLVTLPIAGSPAEGGVVVAYTCRFLRDVATGKRTLPPFFGGDG